MLATTARFDAALRSGHSLAIDVTAYPPGGGSGVKLAGNTDPRLDVVSGGSVTLDRAASIRGALSLDISDPSKYPTSVASVLSAYGAEVHVKRGIRYPDDSVELVSLGWYRVQEVQRTTPYGEISVSGWDRSQQVADERFTHPRKFTSGTYIAAIETLISEVYPSAVFHAGAASTAITTKVVFDQDRWDAITQLAKSIGYEVWVDAAGEWQIQPVPDPATASSVFTVDTGPTGILVSTSDTVTREGVPNGIVATGEEATSSRAPAYALVTDDDVLSPTLWGGPYGHVPRFFSSPLLKTDAQATSAAQSILNDHKGLSQSISFTMVPNPALQPGDAVTVVYSDGSSVIHIIDSITIPLDLESAVTAETRAQETAGE